MTFVLIPGYLVFNEARAWWRRIATGSLGGVSANVRVRLSLQNCIRNAPTVGLETTSGILASSMFRARMER